MTTEADRKPALAPWYEGLREQRRQKGRCRSLNAAARIARVSVSEYRAWEAGRRTPTRAAWGRLCVAFPHLYLNPPDTFADGIREDFGLPPAATFGSWLFQERTAEGLTPQTLGAAIGFSDSAIRKWEAGRCLPLPEGRRALTRFLPNMLRAPAPDIGELEEGTEAPASPGTIDWPAQVVEGWVRDDAAAAQAARERDALRLARNLSRERRTVILTREEFWALSVLPAAVAQDFLPLEECAVLRNRIHAIRDAVSGLQFKFVPHEGLFVGNVHTDVAAGIFDLAEIVVKMERDPLSLAVLALPGIAALASYAKPLVRTREAPPTRNMPVIADLLKKPT